MYRVGIQKREGGVGVQGGVLPNMPTILVFMLSGRVPEKRIRQRGRKNPPWRFSLPVIR